MKKATFTLVCIMLLLQLPPPITAQSAFTGTGGTASGVGSATYSLQPFFIAASGGGYTAYSGVQHPVEFFSLPIDLLFFRATLTEQNTVKLSWATISEHNNEYFTIEKSKDGIHWIPIENVNAVGNSYTRVDYETLDEHPYQGLNYYRLKQTDFDGQFSFSEVQTVEIEAGLIDVYPNPVVDKMLISISSFDKQDWYYSLRDIMGRAIVIEKSIDDDFIHLAHLPSGSYFLQIFDINKSNFQTFKILKK